MTSHTAYELSDWQGYLTHLEIDALQNLVTILPANSVIVKIGAGAGTDTIAILEITQDVVIFSIDILAGERPEITNEHLRLEENGYDKSGCVIRIWGDSKIVGKKWMIPIDWLHVDGDHTFEGISGDLDVWLKHVNMNGYVSFHDYGDDKWPSVKEVVDERMKGQHRMGMLTVDKLAVYRIQSRWT